MRSWYRLILATATILITVPAFSVEWHKAYERGRDRIKKGNCAEGQPLMLEAMRGNAKPDPRTPTYGTQTIEYFPQYYLAICAVQAGRISDAERYLKESEAGRITSTKLANEFQELKARVKSMAPATQQPAKQQQPPPTQQKPPEQKLPEQKPPEKKQEPPPPATPDFGPAIRTALRDANVALSEKRYEDARAAANRILGMDSTNRDARNILNQIATLQANELQAREKQQKATEVEQAIKSGDLDTAENLALAFKVQYPSESRTQKWMDQINEKRNALVQDLKTDEVRKSVEKDVLSAYYRGEYDRVIRLATDGLQKVPQSWRLHFFLGCSYAALSMLEETGTDDRLKLARDSFRRARSISSSMSLPPHISPKILDVYRSS